MPRLLFEKTGNAIWISHLDLMRLFQRAFKRAGLSLVHTQGFNPRPSVSIALPLSVGVESWCELLDFDLEGDVPANEVICEKLNRALVSGVRVLDVYDQGSKIKNLAFLDVRVFLEYDNGVPSDAPEKIRSLFSRPEVIVEKRGKNGVQEQNIIPMIRSLSAAKTGQGIFTLDAKICCQNPTLNPAQIPSAIEKYLPELKPDFSRCVRLELYDTNDTVFR